MDDIFAVFVYTFGTRNYGLEIIEAIDPEQNILKVSES